MRSKYVLLIFIFCVFSFFCAIAFGDIGSRSWGRISWDLKGEKEISSETITMIVENTSQEDLRLTVQLSFYGLDTKETIVLGEYDFWAEDELFLDIPVDTLPIQNLTGTAILVPKVYGNFEREDGLTEIVFINGSSIYYRFQNEHYKKVFLFTREVWLKKYKGIMFDPLPGLTNPAYYELGRIRKNETFKTLKADDPSLIANIDGKQVQVKGVTQMRTEQNMTEEELEEENLDMETQPDEGEEP